MTSHVTSIRRQSDQQQQIFQRCGLFEFMQMRNKRWPKNPNRVFVVHVAAFTRGLKSLNFKVFVFLKSMDAFLDYLGLYRSDVAKDGSCLFRVVSEQVIVFKKFIYSKILLAFGVCFEETPVYILCVLTCYLLIRAWGQYAQGSFYLMRYEILSTI